MDGRQDREEWRRERSLLALGRAVRGEDEAPPSGSLLAVAAMTGNAQHRLDARARHGLARERREATPERAAVHTAPEPSLTSWPADEGSPAWRPDEPERRFQAASAREELPASMSRRRWPSWRLVAATTVLGSCIGSAVAFSLPARYQATAELTFGGENAGRMAAGAVDSQLRVLTSGMVLTKVVDRLNLAGDPEFNGKDGGVGLAGLLRAVLTRGDAAADAGHRQALAVDHLAATLLVARGDAGSIAVTATTGNGEKSALIANAVADAFVEVYGQNGSGTPTGGNGAADMQPDDVAPLAAARRRLGEFAVAHGLGDPAKEPGRVAAVLKLDEDLATARARTEDLNARVASLRAAGVGTAAAGLPREFETGAVEALRAQYLDLKQQADSAAVKLGPRNPQLRAIEAQLAGARERLSGELRRIVDVQQAALKQAVETEQAYAARMARTGLTEEGIAALRDLQQKVAEAEVDRETLTGSVRADASVVTGQGAHVVSKAEVPLQPSGPSRSLLTLAGTMLGLFAGLGIGMLRNGAGREADMDREQPEIDDSRSDDLDDRDAGVDAWQEDGYPPDGSAAESPPWPIGRAPWPAEPSAGVPLYESGSSDFAAIPESMETVMRSPYPDQSYPQSQQPQEQPQWLQPADYPSYPPQPPVQYYPPIYPHQQAYPQAWQPAPPAPYPYLQPAPAHAGQFYPPQPAFPYPPQDAGPAIDRNALDEIRASLHEFREALRELAESRPRRRIF